MPVGFSLRRRSEEDVRRGVLAAMEVLRHPDQGVEARRRMAALQREQIEVLKRTFLSRFEPFDHQMRLFEAGASFKVRATMGGNRSGKTIGGCAETAYHATGLYPDWWPGHRFTMAPKIWVAGKTFDKVVEGVQKMILGTATTVGTGFIPPQRIIEFDRMTDIRGGIAKALIRWGPFGNQVCTLVMKAYSQGRDAFETERVQAIHLDEEPPQDIYDECLMRLMGSEEDDGIMYLTFTPLYGMSSVVKSFLRRRENREELARRLPGLKDVTTMMWHQHVSWDDNPTLSDFTRARMILSMDPKVRQAREKGIPIMGAGLVFPCVREELVVSPFRIPRHWPEVIGIDHGFKHPCGVSKLAIDPNSSAAYLSYVWRQSLAKMNDVAEQVRAIGWPGIQCVGGWDGENQTQAADGVSIHDTYRAMGLEIMAADKITEPAITELSTAMSNGLFKVFGDPLNPAGPAEAFFDEMEFYHRDEAGKIVAENDDAICSVIHAFRHRHHALARDENLLAIDPDYGDLSRVGSWQSA